MTKRKGMQLGAMFAAMLILMATIAVPVAMAETNTGPITGTGCGTCDDKTANTCKPPKSIDKEEHDKIISSISRDISIPENYDLLPAPDDTGFVLAYKTSTTSMTLVDISPSYQVREIWNATLSPMQSSKNIVLKSTKGKEVSITLTRDPSSNTGEITVYDSSSGEITTTSVGCYEICMGGCFGVLGYTCAYGCPIVCAALIPTGLGYIACLAACLFACGGASVVDCDGLCSYIC